LKAAKDAEKKEKLEREKTAKAEFAAKKAKEEAEAKAAKIAREKKAKEEKIAKEKREKAEELRLIKEEEERIKNDLATLDKSDPRYIQIKEDEKNMKVGKRLKELEEAVIAK